MARVAGERGRARGVHHRRAGPLDRTAARGGRSGWSALAWLRTNFWAMWTRSSGWGGSGGNGEEGQAS